MQRIGIYGGTFNPPHLGHIRGAQCATDALGLDTLLLIPDRIAPHKQIPEGSPSPEQRMEMLQIAAAGVEKIQVSDLELKREGPSYTYITIAQVRELYPDAEIFLLMGTDMFLSFHTWRNADRMLHQVTLSVMCRGDLDEKRQILTQKQILESQGGRVELVDNPIYEISSSDLRRLLIFGCAGSFLPEGVLDYIHKNKLYGTDRDYRNLPMEQLEQVVKSLLKPSRIPHVLGCRDTAVSLAKCWGADETDAARAGILHDVTKAIDGPLQLTLCAEYGTILDDFSIRYPKTLHALTGSLVADRVFGENEAVVTAICHHTTGRGGMGLLEKIIYVADYIEPCRTLPGVDWLRYLTVTDLDAALKKGLEMTLEHLARQGSEVSPATQQALDDLNQR